VPSPAIVAGGALNGLRYPGNDFIRSILSQISGSAVHILSRRRSRTNRRSHGPIRTFVGGICGHSFNNFAGSMIDPYAEIRSRSRY